MNVSQKAEIVLREAGMPLHYKEITQHMIERGLWHTDGKTPDATVNAQIAVDIKQKGANSLFQRVDKGIYALRCWNLPESSELDELDNAENDGQGMPLDVSITKYFSFTDAAEHVLKQFSDSKVLSTY